jgi:hypothetical protein
VPVQTIPLPRLPRALAAITQNGRTKSYDTCYKAALNGIIPVLQGENGRYLFEADRLPEIASALGLPLIAADSVSEAA